MIVGLKAFLVADLPAYLTAVVAAKNDGIPLPMPNTKDIVLGAMNLEGYDDYPVVFLVPIGEEYEPLTPSTDLIRATITIWLVIGGHSESDLNRMIWRYGSELRNVARDDPTWDSTVERSEVKEVAYFPVVLAEAELQAVRVTLAAEKELS